MQPRSARFATQVRKSHVAITKATVLQGSTVIGTLYPTDGSVTVDSRRTIRRSASFTLADQDLNPRSTASLISPYSNSEILLERGIRFADGTEELIRLGLFLVTKVSTASDVDGVKISVECEDRSKVVQNKKWANPFKIASATLWSTVLEDIVESRIGVPVSVSPTTYTSPSACARVLGAGNSGSPMNDIVELAESIGQEVFFDTTGTFVSRRIPSIDGGNISLSLSDTDPDSILLSVSDSVGTDDIFNGVIAHAEGSNINLPLASKIWDEVGSSPFRRTGPLGERPYDWSTSYISTQAQLDDVAAAIFDKVRGEVISFSMIPDPCLDAGDTVYVNFSKSNLASYALVDTIEIPLLPDQPMTVTARMRGY